jgi:hypothetical protein|tara:strand:- start:169 stop:333 length:165 start_codon:yes stop_codon:yes gene_type:complete
MEKEQIYGLIRHGLTAVGGVLVTLGYIDEDIIPEVIGAVMTLVGVIWSYQDKKK